MEVFCHMLNVDSLYIYLFIIFIYILYIFILFIIYKGPKKWQKMKMEDGKYMM